LNDVNDQVEELTVVSTRIKTIHCMWGGALNKNSFRVRARFRKNNDAMSQHQCWASHFHIARFRNNVPRKSGFQEKW